MLSYQHAYHAGNHADVLKHFVLFSVIKYMNKKEKPYTFFDTHSGSGLYRIDDERAKKTGEIESGILRLIEESSSDKNSDASQNRVADFSGDSSEDDFSDFLSYIKSYTEKNEYPGSPFIEADFMRECDFLVLSELHPKEIENLKTNVKNRQNMIRSSFQSGNSSANTSDSQVDFQNREPQIQIHKRNGFEMLYSLTPPKTKRGVVLIDPSYEEKSDYDDVADAVLRTFKKWGGGVFMIWYPLLSYRMGMIESMVERITEGVHVMSPNTDIDDFRLCVSDEDSHEETSLSETESPRLFGSGMIIINPPWTLKEKMDEVIPILEKKLRTD